MLRSFGGVCRSVLVCLSAGAGGGSQGNESEAEVRLVCVYACFYMSNSASLCETFPPGANLKSNYS